MKSNYKWTNCGAFLLPKEAVEEGRPPGWRSSSRPGTGVGAGRGGIGMVVCPLGTRETGCK